MELTRILFNICIFLLAFQFLVPKNDIIATGANIEKELTLLEESNDRKIALRLFDNFFVWSSMVSPPDKMDTYELKACQQGKNPYIVRNELVERFDTYGDKIVYGAIDPQGYSQLVVHNISSRSNQTIATNGYGLGQAGYKPPSIWQDKAVWVYQTDKNESGDIMFYNLTSGEMKQLTFRNDTAHKTRILRDANVWGDYVMWDDNSDIMLLDLTKNQTKKIGNSSGMDIEIDGDFVYWNLPCANYTAKLMRYSISKEKNVELFSRPSNHFPMRAWGNRVVWAEYTNKTNWNADVFFI